MLLLKNTKVDVIPIPATLGNVLVYLMTFFAPAIHSGPAKHAMKKVNIIVLLKYLCNIFVDVLPYTVFPQKINCFSKAEVLKIDKSASYVNRIVGVEIFKGGNYWRKYLISHIPM